MPFYIKNHKAALRRVLALLAALSILSGLSSCGQYSLTLNDQSIYQPTPLFNDYQISDLHLRNCVDQTISDNGITAAAQLQRLVCTSAGIKDLAGLEKFSLLVELNLNDNALHKLTGLERLSKLTSLSLKNNQLTRANELLLLSNLNYLDITENPQLDCNDVQQLSQNQAQQKPTHKKKIELYLPERCR